MIITHTAQYFNSFNTLPALSTLYDTILLQLGGNVLSSDAPVGGTAQLKVTTVTLAPVSHDTGDVEEINKTSTHLAPKLHTIHIKTATDKVPPEYAVEGKVQQRELPKQTYLSPIQSDQRLALCHNFLLRMTAQ